MEKKNLNFMH